MRPLHCVICANLAVIAWMYLVIMPLTVYRHGDIPVWIGIGSAISVWLVTLCGLVVWSAWRYSKGKREWFS